MYIVTGASAGIGRAICQQLANRNHQVIACARNAVALNELAEEYPDQIQAQALDLSREENVNLLASTVNDSQACSLVHCAGTRVDLEPYGAIDTKALSHHFQVHVATPIALFQQLLAQGIRIPKIGFIDSYSATVPRVGWGGYSIVKSAAQMAARCARAELSDTQTIRIFPGAVQTGVVDAVLTSNTETAQVFQALKDDGKIATPDKVANFVCKILNDLPDQTLKSVDAWDFNDPQHQALVNSP